jgi:anion-transporting  ArsA/GET3 family ATPase
MSSNARDKKIVMASRGIGVPVKAPAAALGQIPELMLQQQGVAKDVKRAVEAQNKAQDRIMERLDRMEAQLREIQATLTKAIEKPAPVEKPAVEPTSPI